MPNQSENNFRRSVRRIPLYADEPQTLAELFLQAAAKHNRADALNYKKDGVWLPVSSDQMIERAQNIALGIHSLGLRKGDKAVILANNSPEWTLVDAGCQFAGIVDVPIYTTLAPASIAYIVKDSGAKFSFSKTKNHTILSRQFCPNVRQSKN